jgi:hypothetical protein
MEQQHAKWAKGVVNMLEGRASVGQCGGAHRRDGSEALGHGIGGGRGDITGSCGGVGNQAGLVVGVQRVWFHLGAMFLAVTTFVD